MKTIALKVMNDSLEVAYSENSNQPPFRNFTIAYDPDQTIGENLENIRVKIVGLPVDVAIIENALQYDFSDTVVGINHQRIDIGMALMNMLNIPAVSGHVVDQLGLENAVQQKQHYAEWHLDYYGQYEKVRNFGQEAMLTIGNGFFGLRGSYVEADSDQDNYPGTYVVGVYNQLTTKVNEHDVVNEDLVNLPNGQKLTFSVDHQEPFTIEKRDIQDIYRSLNLQSGTLTTTMNVSLPTGHQLRIVTTKVANMKDWHRYGIEYQITPLNFEGSLQVYSTLDGGEINGNVARYQDFDQRHIDVTGTSNHDDEIYLFGQTKTSKIGFAVGSRLTSPITTGTVTPEVSTGDDSITESVSIDVATGQTYSFYKDVAIMTSRETEGNLDQAVNDEISETSYTDTLQSSINYWKDTWYNVDIHIDNDLTSQRLTRVNLFHLFVSGAALDDQDLDASLGARGLHGEAYRGHIFWDEMFFFPFYALHKPNLAKNLLMYRYRRLAAARTNATSENEAGAMYPWQSGMYGDEQSQFVHLNPLTNTWDPDNSRLQRHVSLAIAYNVIAYAQISGDTGFMHQYGLEMLESIAKFWINKAEYNQERDRYDIKGVMGPDEFHEDYPNSDQHGLTNNAYTNIMATWLFNQIHDLRQQESAETLKQIDETSQLSQDDLTKMEDIRHKLFIDINNHGIIGQFEGYFKLSRLNFDSYRTKYGDISRMDRILKSEGKTPDAYQVAKQADALMAFYDLDIPTVLDILKQLGYELPENALTKNLQYYLARTTHGSTLSRVVYSVLTQLDHNMDQSWGLFKTALISDYYDIQGGTTAEGIHLGVMGATTQIETRNYAGVNALHEMISVTPRLPEEWDHISFRQLIRGIWYDFDINHKTITVTADTDTTLNIVGKETKLTANQAVHVNY